MNDVLPGKWVNVSIAGWDGEKLTEKLKILTEEIKFLTEKSEILTEEIKFLTEEIENLTEESPYQPVSLRIDSFLSLDDLSLQFPPEV